MGLLPAAYNPPTVAHVALADRAQASFALDQVVFVLPQALPHKRFDGPGFEQRLRWLATLAQGRPDRAAAACPQGLIIDVVQSFRRAAGEGCEPSVIAGRDAAERFARWDYGREMPFDEQLGHFRLLVAARQGAYPPAPAHADRIVPFEIDPRRGAASSSAVREAIRAGRRWHHWVPAVIRESVGSAYGGPSA